MLSHLCPFCLPALPALLCSALLCLLLPLDARRLERAGEILALLPAASAFKTDHLFRGPRSELPLGLLGDAGGRG
jgi:hypothetical protein